MLFVIVWICLCFCFVICENVMHYDSVFPGLGHGLIQAVSYKVFPNTFMLQLRNTDNFSVTSTEPCSLCGAPHCLEFLNETGGVLWPTLGCWFYTDEGSFFLLLKSSLDVRVEQQEGTVFHYHHPCMCNTRIYILATHINNLINEIRHSKWSSSPF